MNVPIRLSSSTTHPNQNQVTLPNPTNTWEDKKQAKFFSQTQVFLTNSGTKAICEVKVGPPVRPSSSSDFGGRPRVWGVSTTPRH